MEEAAAQKRHWTRLTGACNNRCIFCLDKDVKKPGIIPTEEVFADLQKGRDLGCERAILSGGEATLHPDYFRIVRRARELGYKRVQTVSNGRMFAYREFLNKAIEAGLQEITFSMHGHTEELHEAQTRVPGSFRQALAGIINALQSNELIVNIDIVINKHNYRQIDAIMDYFINLGVHEFDLLHVTPYGDAWNNRNKVFYSPAEGLPYLNRAFAYGRREDIFVWTNRFPPEYLTDYPELIQNPLKIMDEVRGRVELFDALIADGTPLPCRGERCRFCFLKDLCEETIKTISTIKKGAPENIRAGVDELRTADPAFLKRAGRIWLHGKSLQRVRKGDLHIPEKAEIFLDFENYAKLESFTKIIGTRPFTVIVSDGETLKTLLDDRDMRIWVEINKETVPVLLNYPSPGRRAGFKLYKKNWLETEALQDNCEDMSVMLSDERLKRVKTLNIPGCLTRTRPARKPWYFDLGIFDDNGNVSMQKLTKNFIENHYYVFPVECESCSIKDACPGVHVNYLRAFGFKPQPIIKSEK